MFRKLLPVLILGATLVAGGGASAHDGNDDFADASEIPALAFSVQTDNEGATMEEGEPAACGALGSSIWYRWTSVAGGPVQADTFGSDFVDTVLGVYTGEQLDSLEELGCSDDYEDLQSRVDFIAEPAQTYHFQVGGFSGEQGPIRFNVMQVGSIAGTVTNEALDPLTDICVSAYSEAQYEEDGYTWTEVVENGFALTDGDGSYEMVLSSGSHKVRFSDCNTDDYIQEWYGDSLTPDDASAVLVTGGIPVTGIDAVLAVGGRISGSLSDVDGGAVDDTCAHAFGPDLQDWPDGSPWAYTADDHLAFAESDGSYSIRGLPTGSYRVRLGTCSGGGPIFVPRPVSVDASFHNDSPYIVEWYDDQPDFDSATLVDVLAGIVTPDIDAILALRPRPDVAVTDLTVRNVPLSTDAGDVPGPGWVREVSVTIANQGNDTSYSRLTLVACPRSGGRCQTFLSTARRLEPGQTFTRTVEWDAFGMVGDVIIRARARTFDDSDRSNNAAAKRHYVVLGGTGVGINVCESRYVPVPLVPDPFVPCPI